MNFVSTVYYQLFIKIITLIDIMIFALILKYFTFLAFISFSFFLIQPYLKSSSILNWANGFHKKKIISFYKDIFFLYFSSITQKWCCNLGKGY